MVRLGDLLPLPELIDEDLLPLPELIEEGLLLLPEPIDEDLEPILPRILGRLIRLRLPRPDFIRIL